MHASSLIQLVVEEESNSRQPEDELSTFIYQALSDVICVDILVRFQFQFIMEQWKIQRKFSEN